MIRKVKLDLTASEAKNWLLSANFAFSRMRPQRRITHNLCPRTYSLGEEIDL